MGHERIGFLPRTKQWNRLTEQIAAYDGDVRSAKVIADQALRAIRDKYNSLTNDESFIKAIRFFVTLSVSASKENQISFLQSVGYSIPSELTIYSILSNANLQITTESGSLETNKLVRDSAMQAIIEYCQNKCEDDQLSFFNDTDDSVWRMIGNGAAFCEMTRSFFAAFTNRQLRYYIERTAASTIDDYSRLNSFISNLEKTSNEIADHSFEISKLVQSYAAGWYNTHARTKIPTDQEIVNFLRLSFGKLREEFRREAEGA